MLFLLWAVADPSGFSEFLVFCMLAVAGIVIGLYLTPVEIVLIVCALLALKLAGWKGNGE